jgi:hypothetical protein
MANVTAQAPPTHGSLGSYIGKFESLIKDSPAIDIQIPESK